MTDNSSSPFNRIQYKPIFPSAEPPPTRSRDSKQPRDLSYYHQSPITTQNESPNDVRPSNTEKDPARSPHTARKLSTAASMSSESDYSYDSEVDDEKRKDVISAPASVTRRSRKPSKGAGDRRRLAVVQMDSAKEGEDKPSYDTTSTTSISIRSRRGHQSGLKDIALVAPPDAALGTYTQLTPPSTAPISADYDSHTARQDKRPLSDISPSKKIPTRDTASVAAQGSGPNIFPQGIKTNDASNHNRTKRPASPIQDKDNDSIPLLANIAYPSMSNIHMFSPILTPEIGEEKDIHFPVAGPIVVKLDDVQKELAAPDKTEIHGPPPSTTTSVPADTFLPPPRAIFNIDPTAPPPPRPPRLHSPAPIRTKIEAEAATPSVASVLASNFPVIKPLNVHHIKEESSPLKEHPHDESWSSQKSSHRREPATLSVSSEDPSALSEHSSNKAPSQNNSIETSPVISKKDSPIVEELPAVNIPTQTASSQSGEIDHTKFDQWLKENPHFTQPLDDGPRKPIKERERSLSPLSSDNARGAPSPPPKTLRNSFTNNLKRFSALPRTPSLSSRSDRQSSTGTHYSSRTPSPSLQTSSQPSFKRIKSSNPSALFCHEVYSQTTTLQRCAIYAAKINELYIHDCGLSDWVGETKSRGQGQTLPQKRAPSSKMYIPQPRQTSRSSASSEVTFPLRPDATTATDLSQGAYHDIAPSGPPPTLPYPSLALIPPRAAPSLSESFAINNSRPSLSYNRYPGSPTVKGNGGFFASLSRKASLSSSRKDRHIANMSFSHHPSGSGKHISKNIGSGQQQQPIISHPITITTVPTVPGGPRAPRRAQRSQTFMTSVSPPSNAIGRRPSLFNLNLDTVIDVQPDPEFTDQVNRLSALLPHANRNVLAGYLRRAGEDMLAIGQYLEDERMGTLQQF